MKLELLLFGVFALVTASAPAEIVTKTVDYNVGGMQCKGFLAYDGARQSKRPGQRSGRFGS